MMNTLIMENSIWMEGGLLFSESLKHLCLEEGADDAGFVEINRGGLADQKQDILSVYPKTQTLISLVQVMNRENIQSPARYAANEEFHHTIHDLTDTARLILKRVNTFGVSGVVLTVGFPMDMDQFGKGRIWGVSHKPVAEQAGMGRMGIHRNVIHSKFGNFILLETILIDTGVNETGKPLDYNPCFKCNLCVAACPVGAVSKVREFDFAACMTHNYREFMSGFQEWTEEVVESKNIADCRSRVRDTETASIWQSLSFGANYKAAYCMAVCPAGEDILPLYHQDKKQFVEDTVRPLKGKSEPVYVRKDTYAEKTARRFPNKEIRFVRSPTRPGSINGFLSGLRLMFNSLKAKGESAIFQFKFTGSDDRTETISIQDGKLEVRGGPAQNADLKITVDAETWLKIVNEEITPVIPVLTGKLKLKGNFLLLLKFKQWTQI